MCEHQLRQDGILSQDKIVPGGRPAGHGSGQTRIWKSSARASSICRKSRDLVQVAQGLRTARKRQVQPESRHRSEISARIAVVETPPLVEYITPHVPSFHFPIVPLASFCSPNSSILFTGAVKDYVHNLGARLGEVRRVRKSTEEFGRGSDRVGLGFSATLPTFPQSSERMVSSRPRNANGVSTKAFVCFAAPKVTSSKIALSVKICTRNMLLLYSASEYNR
jgi:hypothetical protein